MTKNAVHAKTKLDISTPIPLNGRQPTGVLPFKCISNKYQFGAAGLASDVFWIYNRSMSTTNASRGRPRKQPGSAKSEGVLLRLEPKEKEGFQAAAKLAGVPLSVWMRERLRSDARRELEEVGKDIPFLS